MLVTESLEELYRDKYRIEDHNSTRARRIFPYFPPGLGDLLDVGCSAGHLMELAKGVGWRVMGVEPSDIRRERARQFGEVYHSLEEVEGTFDLVTAVHVLEHVANPAPFLRQMAGVMRPEGTMLVVVPKNAYRSAHLSVMAEPQVRLLFERVGLTITFLETVAVGKKYDIIVRAH